MIDKLGLETFLKVNGIPQTAKDEEIRSVLISARWNKNEVDTALMILKENIVSNETHVDTLHKVFNSDDRLSASEISALLGIDVQISSEDVGDLEVKRKRLDHLQVLITIVLAVCIAVGVTVYLMHDQKVGYFTEQH